MSQIELGKVYMVDERYTQPGVGFPHDGNWEKTSLFNLGRCVKVVDIVLDRTENMIGTDRMIIFQSCKLTAYDGYKCEGLKEVTTPDKFNEYFKSVDELDVRTAVYKNLRKHEYETGNVVRPRPTIIVKGELVVRNRPPVGVVPYLDDPNRLEL